MGDWKKIYLFLFFIVPSFCFGSGVQMDGDGDGDSPPPASAPLQAQISEIEELIRNPTPAHLKTAHRRFMALEATEDHWEALARERGHNTKWAYQKSWKNTLGGYLFYPRERVESLLGFSASEYLLNQLSTTRALKIANLHRYPVSEWVYMTKILGPDDRPKRRWRQTLRALKEEEPTVETLRIWLTPDLHDRKFYHSDRGSEHIIALAERFNAPLFKLRALALRAQLRTPPFGDPRPTLDDFIALGEKYSYGRAFRAGCAVFHDELERAHQITLLEKAVELGDPHSLCRLSGYFRDTPEIAIQYLIRYAEQGFPNGYRYAAEYYSIPDELEKVRSFLKMAAEGGDGIATL